MEGNSTELPPSAPKKSESSNSVTGNTIPSDFAAGGRSESSGRLPLAKIVEIVTLIGGIFALIGFLVSIVITQANLTNSVSNLSKDIQNYMNDNVLIKTQVENWFSRIDTKLDKK